MAEPPYVLLSCAVSVDGYLDDTTDRRLVLSSEADLDRVDEVRAGADAILVGANTVRRDDPRLWVRSARRRQARVAAGMPPDPAKVTITRTGDLDPGSRFFTTGEADRLVYAASGVADKLGAALPGATVVDAGDPPSLPAILADLRRRGVGRLLVEGGSGILSWFLADGYADELHLVLAPLLLGEPAAPRWLRPGTVPPGRLRLAETRELADCVLLRYTLGPVDG